MLNIRIYCLYLFMLVCTGCQSPRVMTIVKPDNNVALRYNKILVVTIIKEENDSQRKALESQVADQLNALGNNAVSSLEEFGQNGLKGLGEIGTYQKLCDYGIDAVLTLSLIDQSNKAYQNKGLNEKYPAVFYYERIWNYRKRQDQTIGQYQNDHHHYIWETILFDLASLKPQYVLQVAGSAPANKEEIVELSRLFILEMLKENIIKKMAPVYISPKPF